MAHEPLLHGAQFSPFQGTVDAPPRPPSPAGEQPPAPHLFPSFGQHIPPGTAFVIEHEISMEAATLEPMDIEAFLDLALVAPLRAGMFPELLAALTQGGSAHVEFVGLMPIEDNVEAPYETIPRADTAEIHGRNRNAATRRSLAALLLRSPAFHPATQTAGAVAGMVAHMDALERAGNLFGQPCPTMGLTLVQRARLALNATPEMGPVGLLHPSNTLMVDAQGIDTVPMATVCAVVWDAIEQLQAPSGLAAETEMLRADRRDAFIRALADGVVDADRLECAPGLAQRMMLVLQGCLPEVQVETYDEVATVNEFVAMKLQQMQAELNDEAIHAERVRRILSQVYLEAQSVYQGHKLQDVVTQLKDFAHLTYDVGDWAPGMQ